MPAHIPEENIILVEKPVGKSSYDVIRTLRRLHPAHIKKAGHAGTLDPFADGLLIVGINVGTKKLSHFLKLPKTYEAVILLGEETDTGDITGSILRKTCPSNLSEEKIKNAIERIVGTHTLAVPIYSAIKQAGKPLYKRARDGEQVHPPHKSMEIFETKLYAITRTTETILLSVYFHVASGTYIRTLAVEIGKMLGVPATLKNLRRTSIGEYKLTDALMFENLLELFPAQ